MTAGGESHQAENTGQAAHIFSAAKNGPRGTGGLSIDQRKHPQNGTWLCYTHGKLIDGHKGARYPASLLQQWKASHEARIDNEHRGLPVPFGWLKCLEALTSPLFRPRSKIEFGKVTLIVGASGTGKTAVCDWMSAILGELGQVWRWMHRQAGRDPILLHLDYASPDPHLLEAGFDAGRVSFSIDRVPATGLGHRFRIVSLKDPRPIPDVIDEIEQLAAICGVHRYRVVQALPLVMELKLPFITKVDVGDEAKEEHEEGLGEEEDLQAKKDLAKRAYLQGLKSPQELRIRIGDHTHDMCFRQLSTREQSISVISIGIAIAYLESQNTPTLLSVELADNWMPENLLNEYAKLLTEDRFSFQSIFVSHSEHPKVDWNGWSIARLRGHPPEVTIEQQLITN